MKMHLYERFKIDALGKSQGRYPKENCKNKQHLTFKYFTQHIW